MIYLLMQWYTNVEIHINSREFTQTSYLLDNKNSERDNIKEILSKDRLVCFRVIPFHSTHFEGSDDIYSE